MKHLVIIRFNAGLGRRSEASEEWKKEWLEHRLKFFRAFTVPSLRAQTNQNFITVLLADIDTPQEVLRELERVGFVYLTDFCQRISVRDFGFREFLGELLGNEKCVVTSRLDSDDAIAKNYVETTQALVGEGGFITYNSGVVWTDGKFFLKEYEAAPFLSMVEWRERTPAPPATVYHIKTHGEVKLHGTPKVCEGEPMWLLACHENNMINVPGELGRELSIEEVNQYFEVDTAWLE